MCIYHPTGGRIRLPRTLGYLARGHDLAQEQRFGVKQKERIKAAAVEIDVLALSATPIPRTMYMCMTGIREMSMLTTPPLGRMAVVTKVQEVQPHPRLHLAHELVLWHKSMLIPRVRDIICCALPYSATPLFGSGTTI